MTAANKITLLRIAMVPLFTVAAFLDVAHSDIIALILFTLASATDGLDGFIARKYNQVTRFGKFIDPLADKLLVMAAILIFVERGQMPSWAALLVVTREFAVTALRLVAVGDGVVIAADIWGKVKTVVSIFAIIVMLTPIHSRPLFSGAFTVDGLAVFLILATTIWSGISYFRNNRTLLNIRE